MRTVPRCRARVRAAAVAAAVWLAPVLAACSTGSSASVTGTRTLRVVAAENFWGSIVKQLAGTHATVTSVITNPDTDPHDYEPTPSDARLLASARYVVVNGIGYDTWARKLLDANAAPGRTVLDVGTLLGIAPGGNPHQWYSPDNVERFIARVTSDLERLDPMDASSFEAQRRSFENGALGEYKGVVAQIRARYAGTPIGASESIVTPLASALRLDLLTPGKFLDAVAEGTDPSANDKATADEQIRTKRIKVFVYNSQNATPDVQRLVDEARAEGIPVTTVTETLAPPGATFQAWQSAQLQSLAHALARATGR